MIPLAAPRRGGFAPPAIDECDVGAALHGRLGDEGAEPACGLVGEESHRVEGRPGWPRGYENAAIFDAHAPDPAVSASAREISSCTPASRSLRRRCRRPPAAP